MFTGIIETTGTIMSIVLEAQSARIGVRPAKSPFEVTEGDSVAIDGVCLTLERSSGGELFLRAVAETLDKTTLGNLRPGIQVNLERAITPTSRLGGHFVLGHVDGVAKIESDKRVGDSLVRTFSLPQALMRFVAAKGSIALDGISLTIATLIGNTITVSIIPYSLGHTTMINKSVGAPVNIEIDVLSRYTARLLGVADPSGEQTPVAGDSLYTLLKRSGF